MGKLRLEEVKKLAPNPGQISGGVGFELGSVAAQPLHDIATQNY